MRLFVAAPVPEDIRKKAAILGKQIEQIGADGVSLVAPGNMHLTLKFLGEIEDSKVNGIKKALDMVKYRQFECSVKRVGVFPNEDYVRVVWAGVESNGKLDELATMVNSMLTNYGMDKEKFSAHLTIARVKKKIDFKEFLAKNKQTEFGKFIASKFELIQSVLGPDGPRYTTIASFELKK